MTTIRMIGEMFQSGKVRTETMTREYYDILVDETERLTRLINKVLDFSRMDSGRKPYEFTIREIGPIVTQAVQVFEVGARTAGYSVRLTLAPDLPPVNADADALAEVMLNLLDNAMKYSLERKDITVTADRQANWVCLSVTDHGIGIDPRQIGRIFDKFYRCEDEMTRQTQGTGVGLAIVKHIVEAHHGRIEAQSKPGEGSTFTVWLPAKGMNEK